MTNTNNYQVWAATLGAHAIEDGSIIMRNQMVGPMFLSYNNTTWSPSPDQYLKFNLIYCKFTSNSITLNFPAIDTMVGGPFIVGASSLVPKGCRINWLASVNGVNYFPIRPNLIVNIEKIWRGLRLKAELIGGTSGNGSVIAPCINYRHIGVVSSPLVGRWYNYQNVGGDVVETNYISENVTLDYSIEQLKVFTEEYYKENQRVEVYFSSDNGDSWISFANQESEVDITTTAYASTSMGGSSHMYDVVRSYTINPVFAEEVPPVPGYSSNEGNTVPPATYYLAYSYQTATGESTLCDEFSITVPVDNNTISFSLPEGSSFPEHEDYNGGKPVRLIGVNVYLGTETGVLARLSESAYDVYLTPGGAVTINKIAYFEDDDELLPPQSNTTQPTQFKMRIRMLGKFAEHLVDNPLGEDLAFGAGDFTVNVEADTGGTAAGDYYFRYAWTTEFGETRPSQPGLVTVASDSSSIYFKFSETPANVNTPSMTFPAGASGARIYASPTASYAESWNYGQVSVEVKRNGVLTQVTEILVTDQYVSNDGFRIVNAKWWVNEEDESVNPARVPMEYNSTGGLIKSSPQLAKLRVIAVDEL